MDGLYKLAQIVKEAGLLIAEDDINKDFNVDTLLGKEVSDNQPGILRVTDDSGYRCIVIGDTRGSRGYAYLYSENAHYSEDGKRLWSKRCFPSIDDIYHGLKYLAGGSYNYTKGRFFEIHKGMCSFEETKELLSDTICKLADLAWTDSRSAEEIVNHAA